MLTQEKKNLLNIALKKSPLKIAAKGGAEPAARADGSVS